MINLPLKVLIGVGSVGVVGLGGYGIYSVASQTPFKTIAQVLEEEGKVLLSFDGNADSSIWNEKFTNFNSGDSNTNKLGSFKKVEGQDESSKKAMKDECKRLSSDMFDSSKVDIKDQVKQWCTKDKPSS